MAYTALGNYSKSKAGHDEPYYVERHAFMDYRGGMEISPLSYWGFGNMVITTSHDISSGEFDGAMIWKYVKVEDYAWITSGCILYNCHIKHHAVVSIGSVVKNTTVDPYTMVSGNPAVVVARFVPDKGWVDILEWSLM